MRKGQWFSRGSWIFAASVVGFLLFIGILFPSDGFGQENLWHRLSLARGGDLDLGNEGSVDSESTVVKLPFAITLKEVGERKVGFKLRVPVYFSWNNSRISDVDGDDIFFSLRTLVITPGLEVLIPVGPRWMLRPYFEFGGVGALGIDEYAWLGSVGTRAAASWDLEGRRFTVGGRLQYSRSWTDSWQSHDDVVSLEIGGSASFPLFFDIMGDRALAGVFFFPRWYFEDVMLGGPEGPSLSVDKNIEIGLSFELPRQPKVMGIKIPAWYGLGYRFAGDYGAWRIYLGFPF